MSKAVILLNLGTPAEPTAKGLRDFYRYFFSDPFMFDFNPIARWALRNLIIQPFRAPRMAKDYARIWTENGSPLQVYADRLQKSVQQSFNEFTSEVGEKITVVNGMAYSKPYVWDVMRELESNNVSEILLLPMFPQYSTATTASIFDQVNKAAKKWKKAPVLHFVDDLFEEPKFIQAWAHVINKHLNLKDVDHVVFSFHGVPEKTIKKSDASDVCQFNKCCDDINANNRYCYRAQCIQTTKSIVRALDWGDINYSVAFQSRLGPIPWLQPYLDEHLESLIKKGEKRVAVITPSFISDCLETLFEIGEEYKNQFMESGGKHFQLVPNLNDDEEWFASVFEMAKLHLLKADRSNLSVSQ